MEYITRSVLAELYAGPEHPIHEDYAELKLLRAVCAGDADAACALFRDKKLFGGVPCVIDTPYKRYEGLAGVRQFAEEWLGRFEAERAEVVPVGHGGAGELHLPGGYSSGAVFRGS